MKISKQMKADLNSSMLPSPNNLINIIKGNVVIHYVTLVLNIHIYTPTHEKVMNSITHHMHEASG